MLAQTFSKSLRLRILAMALQSREETLHPGKGFIEEVLCPQRYALVE